MDAITEHHYHNIALGKTGEDENGYMQTVVTAIVEIDGVETLIPRLWDGKVRSLKDATDFAVESGVNWPTAFGDNAVAILEQQDREIHSAKDAEGNLVFSDKISPELAQNRLDDFYAELNAPEPLPSFRDIAKLIGAGAMLGAEKLGIDTSPIFNYMKGGSGKPEMKDGGLMQKSARDWGSDRPYIDQHPYAPINAEYNHKKYKKSSNIIDPEFNEEDFSKSDWEWLTNLSQSYDTPQDEPVGSSVKIYQSLRPQSRPEEETQQAFYDEKDTMVRQASEEAGLVPPEIAKNEYALGGLATARKGITTEEGLDMADKKFQRNDSEADTNNDGELSTREKEIADAKQKNELPEMAHGGMACSCGSGEECGCGTGMMSEPLPIGTTEAEVADDISVMISEGEYVLPANVVKWHGLKHIMSMQDEAEMGLMMMHSEGLIQEVNNETGEESDSEGVEDAEVSDEGDSEQEEAEEVIETPEGNEIEVAGIDTVITEPEFDETEDYENSDYGKPTSLGTMKRAKYSIIV